MLEGRQVFFRDDLFTGKTISISLEAKISSKDDLTSTALSELGLPKGLAAALFHQGKPLQDGTFYECFLENPTQPVTLTLSAPSLLGGAQAQISTTGRNKVALNADSDDSDDHFKRAVERPIV